MSTQKRANKVIIPKYFTEKLTKDQLELSKLLSFLGAERFRKPNSVYYAKRLGDGRTSVIILLTPFVSLPENKKNQCVVLVKEHRGFVSERVIPIKSAINHIKNTVEKYSQKA